MIQGKGSRGESPEYSTKPELPLMFIAVKIIQAVEYRGVGISNVDVLNSYFNFRGDDIVPNQGLGMHCLTLN